MIYIGIDPGKTGGIAVIEDVNTNAIAYPYSPEKLIDLCSTYATNKSSIAVFVEKVHAMPNQGVTSMFNFGKGYGEILGILKAFKLSYELVTPQAWKKYVGVTSKKSTSIEKAKYLFPDVSLLPTKRSRVPNDGMAEALLIAYYGKSVAKDKEYFEGDY